MQSFYDVIIIGGGGAGLCAAIAAREQGASVLLISKTAPGKANCTAFAGGGFSFAGPGTAWQSHRDKTREIGRQINNPELLDLYCQEGPLAVLNLQQYGMRMKVHASGAGVGAYAPNSMVGGMGMTLPLLQTCLEKGVDLLAEHTVYEILLQEDHVCGAAVLNLRNGQKQLLRCASLVVATGGGGRTYGRTNNPLTTTGDGYHLLYELGLPFRDMEFVQFYPMGLAEEALPMWFIDLGVIDDVAFTDRSGEEFLKNLLLSWGIASGREGNLYARDRTSIAIAKKWQEGDAPLLHLENLTDSQWQRRYRGILRLNRPEHDFTKKPIRIRPLVHYMSGGVIINTECETGLGGLYACGEVTGGIDGANRIGGNALTNISYFGLKAGKNAGNYAKEHQNHVTGSLSSKSAAMTGSSGKFQPADLRRQLNQAMDRLAGPLRSAAGLQEAMAVIADLQQSLTEAATTTPEQLKDTIELQSMLTTAKLVTAGAYERKESRGVHFRSDYPNEDPAWQKPILQNKDQGILK